MCVVFFAYIVYIYLTKLPPMVPNPSLCMLALPLGLPPRAPVPNLKSPSPKPKAPKDPKRCLGTNASLCMLALPFGLDP